MLFGLSTGCTAARISSSAKLMMAPKNPSYESAVLALNSLQSNASVLQANRKKRELCPDKNLLETRAYLEKIGIQPSDLDKLLNVIHVSGTKGKGSTCAFTESILRKCGFRTGFYSSPHLVHVRERIRLNGQPLGEREFARYFWKVYTQLETVTKSENWSMPAYFKFLTILAFQVFLEEKVDVAIMEVGIGGAYDCTNVVQNPVVCGVTTLDYDHMKTLGYTLEEIAWQKAGIFKPNSVAVTIPQQKDSNAMAVLCQRSGELQCPLYLAPPFSSYQWPAKPESGIPGQHQIWNITLALQLAKIWMKRVRNGSYSIPSDNSIKVCDADQPDVSNKFYSLPLLPGFPVIPQFRAGLKGCRWPGRSQVIQTDNICYYLDGAHTPKSIECCAKWFDQELLRRNASDDSVKILLFSCTGDRHPGDLLPYLENSCIDQAFFCPTLAHVSMSASADQLSMRHSKVDNEQLDKCEENRQCWIELQAQRQAVQPSGVLVGRQMSTAVVPCIQEALDVIEESVADGVQAHVLVTGSLHLVGGVLGLIDPELKR